MVINSKYLTTRLLNVPFNDSLSSLSKNAEIFRNIILFVCFMTFMLYELIFMSIIIFCYKMF